MRTAPHHRLSLRITGYRNTESLSSHDAADERPRIFTAQLYLRPYQAPHPSESALEGSLLASHSHADSPRAGSGGTKVLAGALKMVRVVRPKKTPIPREHAMRTHR